MRRLILILVAGSLLVPASAFADDAGVIAAWNGQKAQYESAVKSFESAKSKRSYVSRAKAVQRILEAREKAMEAQAGTTFDGIRARSNAISHDRTRFAQYKALINAKTTRLRGMPAVYRRSARTFKQQADDLQARTEDAISNIGTR